jgi:hypothetical protein
MKTNTKIVQALNVRPETFKLTTEKQHLKVKIQEMTF